jgi:hypothetical protein
MRCHVMSCDLLLRRVVALWRCCDATCCDAGASGADEVENGEANRYYPKLYAAAVSTAFAGCSCSWMQTPPQPCQVVHFLNHVGETCSHKQGGGAVNGHQAAGGLAAQHCPVCSLCRAVKRVLRALVLHVTGGLQLTHRPLT